MDMQNKISRLLNYLAYFDISNNYKPTIKIVKDFERLFSLTKNI